MARFTIHSSAPDGNVWALIGYTKKVMKENGVPTEDMILQVRRITSAKSYEEAKDIMQEITDNAFEFIDD